MEETILVCCFFVGAGWVKCDEMIWCFGVLMFCSDADDADDDHGDESHRYLSFSSSKWTRGSISETANGQCAPAGHSVRTHAIERHDAAWDLPLDVRDAL